MKKIIIIILLICFVKTKAQYNYVANPGFELPAGANASCNLNPGVESYQNTYDRWATTPPWEIPHLKDFCIASVVGSPDLFCGTNSFPIGGGHNSSRYMFTKGGEFLQQQLNDGINNITLTTNHLYYVEYWIVCSAAPTNNSTTDKTGIRFYMDRPRQCSTGGALSNPKHAVPDVAIPASLYVVDGNWHKVSGYYQATDNFAYMAIGKIELNISSADKDLGMYWDDFKVIDVGADWCANINYIQNITFQNIDGIVYKSQTLTTAGNNVDASQAAGNVIVTNTADINFQSATQVALKPGFSVQPGGILHAYIATCTGDCPIISAYVGGEESYCSIPGQAVQLGGGGSSVATYQWSVTSNGTNLNSLLNSTSISNPVLTVPSGAGYLDVSVTAYNTCDGTSTTDEQIIYYDANPVANPIISVTPSNIVIGPSNTHPSFTINGDAHTEQVSVVVFDASGNQINEFDIEDFNIATNGTFSYFYNQQDVSYDPDNACGTFTYKVYSKNICSDNTSDPAIVNVMPSPIVAITHLPNVFTPNGDGINESFCVGVIGATSYVIDVYNADGGFIYNGSGSVTDNAPCVWAGQCNQSCSLFSTQNGIVCDGTYYFVLQFFGCNNTHASAANFTDLFSYCGSGRMANPNDTTNSGISSPKLITHDTLLIDPAISKVSTKKGTNISAVIFPNPTTGLISLNVNSQYKGKLLLNIYNTQGSKVMNNHYDTFLGMNAFNIDLSDFGQGVYFINITDENGVSIKNEKLILIGQ